MTYYFVHSSNGNHGEIDEPRLVYEGPSLDQAKAACTTERERDPERSVVISDQYGTRHYE